MSHSNLTRWIEDAEARNFYQEATLDQAQRTTESQHLHLGGTIATVPSWFRRHGSLTAIGGYACHQLSRIRH